MSLVLQWARELARALRESDEKKALEAALTRVNEHEAARIMLEDLRKRQAAIQKDMADGKDTSSGVAEMQKLYEVLMINPYLRDYLAAEMRLAAVLAEIQKILGDELGLIGPASGAESDS